MEPAVDVVGVACAGVAFPGTTRSLFVLGSAFRTPTSLLGPVFTAISKRALPMYKFEEMQYTGKRLTAQECLEHHIIMKACHLDDLMKEVLAFAKPLKKDRDMIRQMKLETHKELLAVIDETISSLSR